MDNLYLCVLSLLGCKLKYVYKAMDKKFFYAIMLVWKLKQKRA